MAEGQPGAEPPPRWWEWPFIVVAMPFVWAWRAVRRAWAAVESAARWCWETLVVAPALAVGRALGLPVRAIARVLRQVALTAWRWLARTMASPWEHAVRAVIAVWRALLAVSAPVRRVTVRLADAAANAVAALARPIEAASQWVLRWLTLAGRALGAVWRVLVAPARALWRLTAPARAGAGRMLAAVGRIRLPRVRLPRVRLRLRR